MGPGLDVLGCAIAGAGDEVTVSWSDQPGCLVTNPGHADLPSDPARNTAAIAAMAVLAMARLRAVALGGAGIAVSVAKGLPLSGGQGGSAASAVAGAVAADFLAGTRLTPNELALCALEAEARVAGRHLDNIGPSLLGGIVIVRSVDPIDLVRVQVPTGLHIVLAEPAQRLETQRARAVLPTAIPREIVVHQMAQVAAIIAACNSGDLTLLGRAIDDRIAEPARSPMMPGFTQAKCAALATGALGVSISGAGPTAFALVDSMSAGERVADEMLAAYATLGIPCKARVTTIDLVGARVRPA